MQIKFAYNFDKLDGVGDTAMLLEVLLVDIEDVSPALKYQDTVYFQGHLKQYPLDLKGEYMLLFLSSLNPDNPKLFTTLRKYDKNLYRQYLENTGKSVEITIEDNV